MREEELFAEVARVCGPGAVVETLDGTGEPGGFWRAVVPEPPIGFFRYGKGGATREIALERLFEQLRDAPNFDGTPTRAAIDRHYAHHGGHWLVSRVNIGEPNIPESPQYRPMVLRMSVVESERYVWLRATIPGIDFGYVWGDRPFRSMEGSTFTRLTADGKVIGE